MRPVKSSTLTPESGGRPIPAGSGSVSGHSVANGRPAIDQLTTLTEGGAARCPGSRTVVAKAGEGSHTALQAIRGIPTMPPVVERSPKSLFPPYLPTIPNVIEHAVAAFGDEEFLIDS